MNKEGLEKIVSKLNKNKHVIIVGPRYNEKKYRVYAYGGCIGKFPLEKSKGYCELANQEYCEYLNPQDKMDLEALLSKNFIESNEILINNKYLKLILSAAQKRYSIIPGCPKERYMQTEIAKHLMNVERKEKNPFIITDIEFTFPQNKKNKKNIYKPDFIAFNGSSIILIEFKYNGNSIGGKNGIIKHFNDFKNLMENDTDKEFLLSESQKRIKCLAEINKTLREWLPDNFELKKNEISFAFLFVGERENTIKAIKNEFKKVDSNMRNDFKNTLCWFFEAPRPEIFDFSQSNNLGKFAQLK